MLTRTGSLTALNALPSAIKSYDDVLNALAIINPWLKNLELPPVDIPPARSTDFSGSKLAGTLTTLVPKISASLAANLTQSKALAKILSVLASALAYMLSAEYEEEITERIVQSDTFSRLLDQKLEERAVGTGGAAGGQRSGRSAPKPRKERQTDLELHLHYVLHRSINKAFDIGALTVASDLKTWPDGTDAGFFDEVVSGRTLRRWRPVWENIPNNGPFENDVVAKVLQEWPDTYTEEVVRSAFRSYKVNILREKKKQDEGRRPAIQAEMRVAKRGTDLLDSMLRAFEKSLLNSCSERMFYRAMIESRAFLLSRHAVDENHGLPVESTIAEDGNAAGFNAFDLFADLWERKRVRFAFYLLIAESTPTGKQKGRTPVFHLPKIARPVISVKSLPKLAPPSTNRGDAPSASKKPKVEGYRLSLGMVHSAIVDDPAMATWSSLLLQDADRDDSLPSLDELLQSTPSNKELERQARAEMRVDEALTLEQARQLWRIRQHGSDQQYDEALRASSLAEYLNGFEWDDLGGLYA